jgi:hypothetical protein
MCLRATPIALLLLAACTDVDTFEDVGNVLVVSQGAFFDAQEVAFVEGLGIDVRARSGIRASACDEEESSCEIEIGEGSLVVTATFERRRPPQRCADKDAGHLLVAECTSDPLPAGTYAVDYGGETAELVIPSRRAPLQIGPDVSEL